MIAILAAVVIMGSTKIDSTEIAIRANADASLYYFTKYILGYGLLSKKPHADMCAFYEKDGDKLGLEPRDHFKSTIVSIGKVMWLTTKYRDIKILISHKTLGKAKAILTEIKGHYERNEVFRHFYGDYTGEKWTDSEIVIGKREKVSKEPTISTGGVDHEVTGGHYNYIVNDDLVGIKDMVSEAERERVLRYIKAEKYIRDNGFFLGIDTIGTRWNLDDAYAWMMANQRISIRVKKAIDDKGNPYFPSRYNIEELNRIEREDPIMFASQMLNEPLPSSMQIYRADELNYFTPDDLFLKTILPNSIIYAYADLALGKSNSSDYTAIVLGAQYEDFIYIFKAYIERCIPSVTKGVILSLCKDFHIKKFGIESNSFQKIFVNDVKESLESLGADTAIIPIEHRSDKVLRISSMYGTVVNKVRFRSDWENAYPLLIRQLICFPQGNNDDAPDALEGLVSMFECVPNYNFDSLGDIASIPNGGAY